jgi:hypothetical protein
MQLIQKMDKMHGCFNAGAQSMNRDGKTWYSFGIKPPCAKMICLLHEGESNEKHH